MRGLWIVAIDVFATITLALVILLELDILEWSGLLVPIAMYGAARGVWLIRTATGRIQLVKASVAIAIVVGLSFYWAPFCNAFLITRDLARYRQLADHCRAVGRVGICEFRSNDGEVITGKLEREGTNEFVWMNPRGRKGLLVFVPPNASAEKILREPCVTQLAPTWFLLRRC
jgi:hypothetical protein